MKLLVSGGGGIGRTISLAIDSSFGRFSTRKGSSPISRSMCSSFTFVRDFDWSSTVASYHVAKPSTLRFTSTRGSTRGGSGGGSTGAASSFFARFAPGPLGGPVGVAAAISAAARAASIAAA